MKKCLFISYGGGHVNSIIPVIKKLYNFDDIEVCVIGINLAVKTLRDNRIACKTLSDYLTKEALQEGLCMAEKYHNFQSSVSFADSISYYGFSMLDLKKDRGSEVANKIFNIYDRRLFLPINTMKMIIKQEKPDVIIATTMHRFEAAALIAGNELNIPTIKIEDLLGNINRPFPDKVHVTSEKEMEELINNGVKKSKIIFKSDLNDNDIARVAEDTYNTYLNLKPTKSVVLCNYTKENLVSRGIDEESIIVTGQPAFDKLLDYKFIDKFDLCNKLGIDQQKPIVAFMSQPLEEREEVLRSLINGMKENNDKQLIIKLHPNEDGIIQKMILDEMKYDALIIKDVSAPEIISISDLVITVSSTTGLEAVVMDKDLLSINLTSKKDFIPYNDMGIGVGVYDSSKIGCEIRSIFEDESLRQRLKEARSEFATDGNASSRIAKIILDELSS